MIEVVIQFSPAIWPSERHTRFEGPLSRILQRAKLGTIFGSGTRGTPSKPESWSLIHLRLTDKGLHNLIKILRYLQFPKSTSIHTCSTGGRNKVWHENVWPLHSKEIR